MKILLSTLLALSIVVFMLPSRGNVAELEPLGIISVLGGAERETGQPTGHSVGRAGGRGTIDALGVLPFAWPGFGLQAYGQYVGGQGSRFGAGVAPIYAFDGGKTGLSFDYQRRSVRSGDFFWIGPVLALYFDQMNVNLRYTHPVSGIQRKIAAGSDPDFSRMDVATNKLQGTVSYFPPVDLGFVRKDNLELTFGAQVNSFAGHNVQRGAGVGPVFGAAFMPWQNVEVTLFKGTVDNRSRYQVNSGLRFFFSRGTNPAFAAGGGPTLKELRRKYLEVGPGPVAGFTGPISGDD